jgi:Putative zinc-finger
VADESKFGQKPGTPGGAMRCEDWEAQLTDALDGLLPAGQAAVFTAHAESCENCGDLLAHVKQGQEWLNYLHEEPEIPWDLVPRILEKTVGAGGVPIPVVAAGVPAGGGAMAMAMPWRRSFHETRLLMTVAMAFFSLALTLNLVTGGHLTSLHLADLRPSQIGNTVSREFYGARSSVVRYYDNMRFFYQLQSRMRELRRDVEQPQQQQNQQQQNQQQQQQKPRSGGSASADQGTGLRAQGTEQLQAGSGNQEEKQAVVVGLKSDQTGSSISLGRSETGLRQANVERGLV